MGAVHDGHASLVRVALAHADVAVASVFVNPTQFAPNEDFAAYPRSELEDVRRLGEAGCSLVYCPAPEEIYPEGDETRVSVPSLGARLEGVFRPHFFQGVATVVARLFVHVRPDVAVFGEKDFQQLQVIRRMTTDFGFPTRILGAPTVRESDGLAMSSRNAYLAAAERQTAPALHRILAETGAALRSGAPCEPALSTARERVIAAGFSRIDYIEACDADTLVPLASARDGGRLLAAAWLGRTRLIDNIAF